MNINVLKPSTAVVTKKRIFTLILFAYLFMVIQATAWAVDWAPTGSLNYAHNDYHAILLNDGRVLVQNELYDPTTGGWTLTGPMVFGAVFSTFDLMDDGRVLVTGQHDYWYNPPAPYAQIYDPTTDTWTSTTNMSKGRSTSLSTKLADGRILVAGGLGGDTSVEIYNPATQTWSIAASMNEGHTKGSMVLLKDGRVLVSGGTNDLFDTTAVASVELYNPASNSWTVTGSLPTALFEHQSVVMNDGRVLTMKGTAGYVYDPVSSSWSITASLANAYNGNSLTLLVDGKVLAAGSLDFGGTLGNTAEIYDPATNSWTAISNLPETRGRHAAARLDNGNVLLAGGIHSIPTCCDITTAVVYTPGSASVPPVPSPASSQFLHIGDLDGNTTTPLPGKWLATVTFTVLDENNQPVSGVVAKGSWSGGYTGVSSCVTNTAGQCDVFTAGYLSLSSDPSETLTVADLYLKDTSLPAMTYDPAANTDPDGDSDGTIINVLAPQAPTPVASTLHISDIDGSSNKEGSRRWRVNITLHVNDNLGAPVANAAVSGDWSNGLSGSASCTTDSNGMCVIQSDKIKNRKSSVTFSVTAIQHNTLNYNAVDNTDPENDSNGTQITVQKP